MKKKKQILGFKKISKKNKAKHKEWVGKCLTVQQVAHLAGVSAPCIGKWVSHGVIPSGKKHPHQNWRRFKQSELLEIMAYAKRNDR